METKDQFYNFIEEKPDNKIKSIDKNLASSISEELIRGYFFPRESLDAEIEMRTINIFPKSKQDDAKKGLSDFCFKQINFYEESFKNFSQNLKKMIWDTLNDNSYFENPEDAISYHLRERDVDLRFYESNLEYSESKGVGISGLPKKLNYLEHLN